MTAITRWHFLRHAPADIAPGTVYGRSDPPARPVDPDRLSAIVRRLPEDALSIASGWRRAEETARMLRDAGWTAEDAGTEPAFGEQDFGAWEGSTHAVLSETGNDEYRNFWNNPARNRPPAGESFADVMDRVGAALHDLTARHAGRDIVLVAHGGSIRAALAVMLDLSPERALAFEIAPLSLTQADHVAPPDGAPSVLSPWRVRHINLPSE